MNKIELIVVYIGFALLLLGAYNACGNGAECPQAELTEAQLWPMEYAAEFGLICADSGRSDEDCICRGSYAMQSFPIEQWTGEVLDPADIEIAMLPCADCK